MGLVRRQKIGDGMLILGRGKYRGKAIDITLLEIGGIEFHRTAKLDIKGVDSIKEPLKLCADQNYVKIDSELNMRVSNGSDFYEDAPGESVFIDYDAPIESYKMNRKEIRSAYSRQDQRRKKEISNANSPVGFHYREEWKRHKI